MPTPRPSPGWFLTRQKKWDGRRVGLYGGSFNPAHEGHRHVALVLMRRLKLDAVWWLVSPQNPLKASDDMGDHETRLARAHQIAAHPRFFVTDIERHLGTQYTRDTIENLMIRHRYTQFVWMMGADNLAQFHLWEGAEDILNMLPIAIFDRPGYSNRALASPTARHFAKARRLPSRLSRSKGRSLPAWSYLRGRLHPLSGTALRKQFPVWYKMKDIGEPGFDHDDGLGS
ncbi:MAG: nicotinate-nucleotide adenylyltransferase [Pseudomonadota bacterium]